VIQVGDERVRLRDGTSLATDICLDPSGPPRPALLIRTPYSRAAARDAYDLVGLAREGWGVVLQDVRGRFDSTGEFDPFLQEVSDGVEVVGWCAEQPWCDGRVVMTGISYLGGAQWAAAHGAPPALAGINPSLAPASPPAASLREGGALLLGLAQPWMLGVLASSPSSAVRPRAQELAGDWRRVLRAPAADDPVRALSRAYDLWRSGVAAADEWLPVRVPGFQLAGWYDPFCESAIRAHARQAAAGVPIVTVVGPWTHNERLTNMTPEWDFGPAANGELADVRGEGLRWLRARLAGEPASSYVRYFVMGAGEWRTSTSWPPAGMAYASWHFAPDGTLVRSRADNGVLSWRHDPADPVPSWGGRVLGPMLPLPGPADQRPVQQRRDVVVFTSDVLAQPVDIAGEVRATVTVSSSARSMDVTVKLCDVHPDGRAFNVVDGIQRMPAVAAAETVAVSIGNVAHTFLPGHRIQVEVAGSNFPRFDLNPQIAAEHQLYVGGHAESHLDLPLV
jgi:uncharacterized protein